MTDTGTASGDQPDLTSVPWRTGTHLGQSVYACVGTTGGKPGTFIGTMDTEELAAEACRSHNDRLATAQAITTVVVTGSTDPEYDR